MIKANLVKEIRIPSNNIPIILKPDTSVLIDIKRGIAFAQGTHFDIFHDEYQLTS